MSVGHEQHNSRLAAIERLVSLYLLKLHEVERRIAALEQQMAQLFTKPQ